MTTQTRPTDRIAAANHTEGNTEQRPKRRFLFIPISVLAAALAAIVFAAFAFLQDTDNGQQGTISDASFDADIFDNGFTISNMEPGDRSFHWVSIRNQGNQQITYSLDALVSQNGDGGDGTDDILDMPGWLQVTIRDAGGALEADCESGLNPGGAVYNDADGGGPEVYPRLNSPASGTQPQQVATEILGRKAVGQNNATLGNDSSGALDNADAIYGNDRTLNPGPSSENLCIEFQLLAEAPASVHSESINVVVQLNAHQTDLALDNIGAT